MANFLIHAGYFMQYLSLIAFSMLDVPPMFVLLTSVPLVLLGGSMTFFTGAFSYVNDVSSKEDLPSRYVCAKIYVEEFFGTSSNIFMLLE